MIKKILGLDISSSCIGYCVLNWDDVTNDIHFNECNYLNPSKKGSMMERIVDTRDKLNLIIDKVKPDYIGIEELIKFMPKSTATTVVILTTFNRMVCLLAYDYLKTYPGIFNVLSIRHALKTGKELPKKEDMPELVAKHLGITFPYVYGKDKKGNKKIKEESRDMADGVAVALYYAFILSQRVKVKIKKPKKKGKKN